MLRALRRAPSSCTASRRRSCSRPALERGWYVSFAGNVTYPKAADAARGRRGRARRPDPRRDRQPVSRAAAASAAGRTSRRNVVHTVAALAEARGEDASELARADRRQRSRCLRATVSVRPKKPLGQHFLVDENILGVIGRLAELAPDDVVLEIGPGLGVLTRYLADRVAHVHAVELDRSLEPHLAALAERPNVDAPLGRRAPARPRRARAGADEARREPALQRRHADRRREPRRAAQRRALVRDGAARGRRPLLRRARRRRRTAPSRCSSSSRPSGPASIPSRERSSGRRRTSTRRSSPSVACRCRTTSPGSSSVVDAAFAHRRKTLPNSLALAGLGRARRGRRRARSDRPRRRRRAPRRSSRREFVALAEALRETAPAPAKINLALVVGPPRGGRQARGRDRAPAHRSRRPRRDRRPPRDCP